MSEISDVCFLIKKINDADFWRILFSEKDQSLVISGEAEGFDWWSSVHLSFWRVELGIFMEKDDITVFIPKPHGGTILGKWEGLKILLGRDDDMANNVSSDSIVELQIFIRSRN